MKKFFTILCLLILLVNVAYATNSPTIKKVVVPDPKIISFAAEADSAWPTIVERLEEKSEETEGYILLEALKIVLDKQYKKFKPHPDPILKALEMIKYDGDLSKVAYIGDAMNDALCANAAGVDAILLDRIDEYDDSDKYLRIHSLMELFV